MPEKFHLTKDHITLLRHAYVEWQDCEFGAPGIDPKRPYGNDCVESDILELLGEKRGGNEDEPWSEAQLERASTLHRETLIALQIILCVGRFEPGHYKLASKYHATSWERDADDIGGAGCPRHEEVNRLRDWQQQELRQNAHYQDTIDGLRTELDEWKELVFRARAALTQQPRPDGIKEERERLGDDRLVDSETHAVNVAQGCTCIWVAETLQRSDPDTLRIIDADGCPLHDRPETKHDNQDHAFDKRESVMGLAGILVQSAAGVSGLQWVDVIGREIMTKLKGLNDLRTC